METCESRFRGLIDPIRLVYTGHNDVDAGRRLKENGVQRFAVLSPGVFLCVNLLLTAPQRFQTCLPAGIAATDVVSAQLLKSSNTVKKTTVAQKLTELKARCKSGRLVDATGKQIYFCRLEGCWGNPPPDYQEILARQEKELKKLRKRYLVIEMTCNPEGVQIH